MQINLKQSEIVDALKQYVQKQGISLKHRDVTIAFTAGRKETGLSAEIVIEDVRIPGLEFGDDEGEDGREPARPSLSLVDTAVVTEVVLEVVVTDEPEAKADAPQEDAIAPAVQEPVEAEPPVATAPVKIVTSLFN